MRSVFCTRASASSRASATIRSASSVAASRMSAASSEASRRISRTRSETTARSGFAGVGTGGGAGAGLPAELGELGGADSEPGEQVVPGPAGGRQLLLGPGHVVVHLQAVVAVHPGAEHRPGVEEAGEVPRVGRRREERPDVVVGLRLGSLLGTPL